MTVFAGTQMKFSAKLIEDNKGKVMKARKSTSNVSQPEVGTHVARLVGIVDLGHQPGFEYQGKPVPSSYKIRLTYELPNSKMDDGRPHWVSEEITNSDNEKSTLSARVRTLKGTFDDLTSLLNKPCMVTLVETKNGYVKIDGQGGVGGIPAGFEAAPLSNPTFVFSLDTPDLDVFNGLPEFIQDRIRDNLDYIGSELQMALENPQY